MRSRDRLSFWEGNKTCFFNSFKFNGRARRSEFWNFALLFSVYIIIFVLLINIFIARKAHKNDKKFKPDKSFIIFFISGFIIEAFLFSIIILGAIRRLHDTGRSGFYGLLFFVPFGLILLIKYLAEDSLKESNKFGGSPKYYIDEDPLIRDGQRPPQLDMRNSEINNHGSIIVPLNNSRPQLLPRGQEIEVSMNIPMNEDYNNENINDSDIDIDDDHINLNCSNQNQAPIPLYLPNLDEEPAIYYQNI